MQNNNLNQGILNSISEEKWDALSSKKIYFGHQSVGFNIMDGIKDITAENKKIHFKIKETNHLDDFSSPIFGHSANGVNTNWQSKIDGFRKKMDSGLGNTVDIAFFKFCYVDVTVHTDIDELFQNYKTAMDELEKKYPDIKFIHVTAPLGGYPSGIKGIVSRLKEIIKPLLGKENTIYANNIKRMELNRLIISEYPQDRIFDLAKAEATKPNGQRKHFMRDGKEHYLLCGEYTNDGGHLNELGKKIVAQKLLFRLVELI